MNVAFFAYISGLGNNGGSNTIVCTAHELRCLGHEVDIIATIDRYNRDPHPPIVGISDKKYDAICAVLWMDVKAMHKLFPLKKKFWWMRAWNNKPPLSEQQILECARAQKTIVNASWMQRRLQLHGIKAELVHQGIDSDYWSAGYGQNREKIIGACWRPETKKCFNEAQRLFVPGYEKSFAHDKQPYEMRDWYNSLDYFLAPSECEGLPNTPLEAALCNAALICKRREEAGCGDFADDANALLYDDIKDVPGMIWNDTEERKIERIFKLRHSILEKIGDRETCAMNLERIFGNE
jgi:hypothetical protein